MWSIFHTVTFFEKALKRSGLRKTYSNLQNNLTSSSNPLHPMASHLSWMLPPLLKVCIHHVEYSHQSCSLNVIFLGPGNNLTVYILQVFR